MFGPVTIPYGVKLLFNTVKLKPGVTYDDVELALAEMCNVVKETYGGDKGGFIAELCTDSRELGYDMLWQGAPERAHTGAGAVTA